jgi:hypothetical protein
MFELYQIFIACNENESDFLKKLQIYLIDGANIESPNDWLYYVEYWKNERDKLRQKINDVGWEYAGEESQRRLKYMNNFTSHIADFLAVFADLVQPRSFDDFLDVSISAVGTEALRQ